MGEQHPNTEPMDRVAIYEALRRAHEPVRPSFDIRQSAQSNASIFATLCGFSFAGVVLVVRTPLPTGCPSPASGVTCAHADLLHQRASLAFLVALSCFICAALAFSSLRGEELLTRRCFNIAVLTSGAALAGAGVLLWGLVVLARVFLGHDAIALTRFIMVSVTALGVLLCGYPVMDAKKGFDPQIPQRRNLRRSEALVCGPALILIGLSVVVRWVNGSVFFETSGTIFSFILGSCFVVAAASTLGGLRASDADFDTVLSDYMAALWLAVASSVIAILIVLLP